MTCEVSVSQGRLRGKVCTTYNGRRYYSFEGIPYAKPPVGDLRFKEPQEPENWNGIRDATKIGNKCAQVDPYSGKPIEGSEDCLYLNVYTPSLTEDKIQKLPVLFFVHGGRFLLGHGGYYKPDYQLYNDVILVTINYRLNVFGFICLDIPEAPGNAGLKDTVMALKWVKNNISFFNGNSNNVTAIGESAGAGITSSFLVSKMTDGLVHKVVAQSGTCVSDLFMVEEDVLAKAKNLVSCLDKDFTDKQDIYNCLMNASVEELLTASATLEVSRPPTEINAYFLPVVEKMFDNTTRFFEEYPVVTIKENRFKKIPIITGHNSHEGATFIFKDGDGNIMMENDLKLFIPRYSCIKNDSDRALTIERRLREYYFKGKKVDGLKCEFLDFLSDVYFNRDIMMFVDIVSKYHKDLYYYNFTYNGNMNTRVMKNLGIEGSSHGDIIMYQFYRKNKAELCKENDEKIINMLSEAWYNFARYGKPTWSNQPTEWSPYSHGKLNCLQIDKNIKLKNYNQDRYNLWKNLLSNNSKL